MSGKQEWYMAGVYSRGLLGGMHGALPKDEILTLARCHSFMKP